MGIAWYVSLRLNEGPVGEWGPFPSRQAARSWHKRNRSRIEEDAEERGIILPDTTRWALYNQLEDTNA